MKTLWTPWRMEHVRGELPKCSHCIFEPPGEMSHSRESLLLYRDDLVVTLLNRFPYANGHLMVAPRRHIDCLTKLDNKEHLAISQMLAIATAIIRDELRPDGFNVGLNLGQVAGAGIADHLHYHIVPRWSGDHNFITVLGEVRTIPEHLLTTFDRLLPEFIKLRDSRS